MCNVIDNSSVFQRSIASNLLELDRIECKIMQHKEAGHIYSLISTLQRESQASTLLKIIYVVRDLFLDLIAIFSSKIAGSSRTILQKKIHKIILAEAEKENILAPNLIFTYLFSPYSRFTTLYPAHQNFMREAAEKLEPILQLTKHAFENPSYKTVKCLIDAMNAKLIEEWLPGIDSDLLAQFIQNVGFKDEISQEKIIINILNLLNESQLYFVVCFCRLLSEIDVKIDKTIFTHQDLSIIRQFNSLNGLKFKRLCEELTNQFILKALNEDKVCMRYPSFAKLFINNELNLNILNRYLIDRLYKI